MKHFPKIISSTALVLTSVILLTSCGQPTVNEDFSKALSDHINAFYTLTQPLEISGFKGKIHGDATLSIDAKDQVEGKANLNVDSKLINQESLSDIGIAWDGTINKEALNVDAKASIGAFSGKLYAKLQSLNLSGSLIGPMKNQIDSVVFLFKDKWFVQALTKLGLNTASVKFDSKITPKDIIDILASKPVLEKKSDLPITDNFYRYAVGLNTANIIDVIKTLSEKINGKPLPADEVTTMQEGLSKMLFDGTLAIDSKNPAYMTLSGTLSQSGSIDNNLNVQISFLHDAIDFVFAAPSEKITASLHLVRKDNTFSGPFSIENGNSPENSVIVNISFTPKTNGSSAQFDTAIPNPQDPKTKINLSLLLNFSSTKDATITLEEPKDAKPFEELTKSFMGQQNPLPLEESGTIDTSVEDLAPATETGDAIKEGLKTEGLSGTNATDSLKIEIPASKK